jgi:hypothetical protein
MIKYRSQKIEAGSYRVVNPDGTTVATITLTGRPGVDDYPWDYVIHDDRVTKHSCGVTDSKSAALDRVLTLLATVE